MVYNKNIEAHQDYTVYPNAVIGKNTLIEPDVHLGWRYHKDCGRTVVGKHGIFRKGTIIYADVILGDYFQSGSRGSKRRTSS